MHRSQTATLLSLPQEIRLIIWSHLYNDVIITVQSTRGKSYQRVSNFPIGSLLICRRFTSEITDHILRQSARTWKLCYEKCEPPFKAPNFVYDQQHNARHASAHIKFLDLYAKYITWIEYKARSYTEPAFLDEFDMSWFSSLDTLVCRTPAVIHKMKRDADPPAAELARKPIDEKRVLDEIDNPVGLAARSLGVKGLKERWHAQLESLDNKADIRLITVALWDPSPGVNKYIVVDVTNRKLLSKDEHDLSDVEYGGLMGDHVDS